jgi:regulation of enolase protein 1 (concanavalin A-like superfamily)
LHFKTGLQFDWSAQDDFIKAVEIGFSYDEYFTDVPLMLLVDNKARFFNLYLGIALGKKK